MTGSEGPLRLRLELTDAARVLPRIVTLVTGRAFVIDRCEYERTGSGGARLRLHVTGAHSFHANLTGRLRQVVGVVALATLPTPLEAHDESRLLRASRVRASTRIDGDEVTTELALKLASGASTCLVAGEGCGPVEAVVRAFERGVDRLYPDILRDTVVTSVNVVLVEEEAALGGDVQVVLSASDGDRPWTAEATATDIVDAATQAATRLFGAIVESHPTRRSQTHDVDPQNTPVVVGA